MKVDHLHSIDQLRLPSGKGLLGRSKHGISKQRITEHRMFGHKRGSHGKNLKVGRKFSGGKPVGLEQDLKSSAISPSVEEYDRMMENILNRPSRKKKFGMHGKMDY